jgi:hypothetical protein
MEIGISGPSGGRNHRPGDGVRLRPRCKTFARGLVTPNALPGYSGTPLIKKLGIKTGSNVLIANAPDDYLELLGALPAGVKLSKRLSANVTMAHVFTTRRLELTELLNSFRSSLGPEAVVWVSWPKKSSKVPTQVTDETIRSIALPLGFVDVKVCAVTDVWSGLKLVVRKELR